MSITQRTSDPPIRGRLALPVAAGAGFLAGLDTTAVNLALPDIQRTLAAVVSRPHRSPRLRRPAVSSGPGSAGPTSVV